MKALDLKYVVLDALELSCEGNPKDCVYSDREFLMHLNEALEGITMDMIGKDLSSYTNLKKKVYDLKLPNIPGGVGYAGRYKLPTDILSLKNVEVSLDGTCWVEGVFSATSFDFQYECNNCPCPEPNCGIDLRLSTEYLEISPKPTKPVAKGLVMWYEASAKVIEDVEEELPFKRIDQQYVALLIVDYYMAIHTDKFSTTKVNRVFNKFNRSKKRFDKLHNMQTKRRVQKRHQRPYL